MAVDEASLNTIRQWSVPSVLTGNIFIYGRPGSGKSCKMLTVAQGLYEKGFKIWDIFGGKRDEGPFWSFPNDDYKLWADIESETNEFKVPGPKQYPVKLLYPMFSKNLPRRLPNNPPNVTSKIFTIPIHDLQEEMEQILHTITGPLSSTSVRLWDKVLEHTKPNDNGQSIKELFNEKMPKKKDDKIYDTFIRTAISNHLLSSDNCELNLDWIAEAEDKQTITVLCLDYVPEKFKLFIMAYVMKKLFHLVKNNQIHKKNLALFREASLFMKVVDADASKEDSTSIFRNIITDIARYCRSGLYLIMDSQDSSEVRGMIEGADDLMIVNEMPSQKSREVTFDPLLKDKRITANQIAYVGWKILIHQALIIERGQKAKILKRIHPPRCRYWKSDYGDFFSLWKKEVNVWTETQPTIQKIINEYLESVSLDKIKKLNIDGKEVYQPNEEELKELNEEGEIPGLKRINIGEGVMPEEVDLLNKEENEIDDDFDIANDPEDKEIEPDELIPDIEDIDEKELPQKKPKKEKIDYKKLMEDTMEANYYGQLPVFD